MAKIKPAIEGASNLFDMLFLHNTDADKLKRIQQMGGMPMPSIAATRKDIPLEDYGDITLIGRKDMFDPSNKSNPFWNADAYTVRAPSPLQMTQKGAGKRFDADYAPYEDYGYTGSARSSIWDLESKRGLNESEYNNAINFFESNGSALAKFADDMGILPEGADVYQLRELRDQNRFAFDKWMNDEVSRYFQPEQYFISKPSQITDTGRTSATLKPYTADEVTKFMKKSKGAAQESSITIGGTGANRAAVADRLKSFDQMRSSKDMLKTREESAVSRETLSMMQDDLMEALKPYYKYSADGWMYNDEAGGMMLESAKKGLDRALNEYGFENVPDSLKQDIKDWQQQLRTAPTQYFEGKPERPVSLREFAGAIVPEGASPETIGLLQKFGLDVQKYSDDAQRTALRDKYQSEMFVRPETVIATGLLGSQQDPQQLLAQQELEGLMGQYNQFMDRKPDIYNYGDIAPVKRNVVTGEYSAAVPKVVDEIVKGLLDIGQSRKTGVVNNPTSIWDVLL
jgi:hypothetical protein